MKQFFLIAIFVCFECKAQIKSLYDDEYAAVDGAYYKDTHNDFDSFTGTWVYTNGSTSLTITLQKKSMVPSEFGSKNIFEDVIVGEYKYIENNVEKINTLNQLSLNLPIIENYGLSGNTIIRPGTVYCQDCGFNDRKIVLAFRDPNRIIEGYEPEMIFQRVDSNGQQKLKLKFRPTGIMLVEEGVEPEFTSYTVPFGEYILVKQ